MTKNKYKILQVNVVYNTGSTGRITCDLHKYLLDSGFESVVCYGRGKKVYEPGIYKTCFEWYSKLNNALSRITGIMYGGCYFSTSKLIRTIEQEKPDIVHIQCINGFFVNIYRFIDWLKRKNVKTVLTLHAEFMFTANCSHAYECTKWINSCENCEQFKKITHSLLFNRVASSFQKMKNAFQGFNRLAVVSVSPWLKARAEQSSILRNAKHNVIFNGVDTEVFHCVHEIDPFLSFRSCFKKIILHVTADFNDPNKGGKYLIEVAKTLPEYMFVVVGNSAEKKSPLKNLAFIGKITNPHLLAEYYSFADLTVITSKRETFSMICAESLSCGTPVVGFRAGGPEQISIEQFSEFCDYGNSTQLRSLVEKWASISLPRKEIENIAEKTYSVKTMCQKYLSLYQRVLEEG